jgi:hypothetical protein
VECVIDCDLLTRIMRRPWLTEGSRVMEKINLFFHCRGVMYFLVVPLKIPDGPNCGRGLKITILVFVESVPCWFYSLTKLEYMVIIYY